MKTNKGINHPTSPTVNIEILIVDYIILLIIFLPCIFWLLIDFSCLTSMVFSFEILIVNGYPA